MTDGSSSPSRTALDRLMHARSVAVIGASSDEAKIGGKPVALMKAHFSGKVLPVNPNRREILGLPALKRITDATEAPDVAVVAVPASAAEAAVDDCLAAGVGSIVLFSAGFGEIDAAGRAVQERIAAKCAAAKTRLLGPNSIGVINFHSGLYATFSAALDNVWPRRGGIGIASQSGAVGTYIMALAAEAGLGFSHFIATGNEADIDVADSIAWLADDPATTVIFAYVEGCRDGDRLKAALAAARAAGKPVIAIRPGASESGQAAVKSHTGALAGSKFVFDAVIRAYGAWPAQTIEEAVDLAYACSAGKFPSTAAAGIVTPSGGVGIMLADACDAAGIALPSLAPEASARIRALLPLASTGNPVDTTAQVANDFRLFGKVTGIVADGLDAPALFVFMAHMGKTPAVTDLLKPALHDLAARHPKRVLVLITRASEDFHREMSEAGYLVFQDPTRAVAAVRGLLHFGRTRTAAASASSSRPRAVTDCTVRDAARTADGVSRLLAALGLGELPVRTARTAAEAVAAADALGYPVALKIASPDIQHKTEVGGVRLGLADADAVARAWSGMTAMVAARIPQARIEGATVSPMLVGGVETIIGTQNDRDLGPVVMFGLGGTMAEALKDVVFAPAPLDHEEALGVIGSIRGKALFDGWRGAPPVDREALAHAIVALSRLAVDHREILESVEVNPFVALPEGGIALDVLVQLREA